MQKELNFKYNELTTPFEWSYSPYTKMWYEDKNTALPEFPIISKSIYKNAYILLNGEFSFTEVTNGNYEENAEEEEFTEYINYLFGKTEKGCDCFSLTLLLFFKNCETNIEGYEEICFCHDNLPLIEEFINNINRYGYASIYIEAFSGVKFFAWLHDDKIHFVIQDYKYARYKDTDTPLFKILCNIQADREDFCNRILELVNLYKVKCKNAIKNYMKINPSAKLSEYDMDFINWIFDKEQKDV